MLKNRIKYNLKLFSVGGVGYGIIELLYRGRTHWSMLLAGGTCFVALSKLFRCCAGLKMHQKCLLGSALITLIEFLCGCVVNLKLKLNVWDYTNCRFNIKGQICPFYSFLWALLCIPVSALAGFMAKKEKS